MRSVSLGVLMGLMGSMSFAHAEVLSVSEIVNTKMAQTDRETFLNELSENNIHFSDVESIQVDLNESSGQLTVLGTGSVVPPSYLVFVGAELGSLLPYAVQGVYLAMQDGKPFWSVDVKIEPSNYFNSLSIGGTYHPFRSAFFVGARLRQLFLHAPWSRGYEADSDSVRGLGLETGFQWLAGKDDRFLFSLSLGGTYVPSTVIALPVLVNLNAGVSIRVF